MCAGRKRNGKCLRISPRFAIIIEMPNLVASMKKQSFLSALAVPLFSAAALALPAVPATDTPQLPSTPPLLAPLRGWQVWPATGERVIPSTQQPVGVSNATIRVVGARGATASASFALRSAEALDGVSIKVEDLADAKGNRLPDSAIDIRVVKLWYQDANGWFSDERAPGEAVLVPELLLHDDSLVQTDPATKENVIRSADGTSRRIKAAPGGSTTPSLKGFVAADDAPALLPLGLAANETRQFFMKFDIAADAAPGLYKGRVTIAGKAKAFGSFDLFLKINDFTLGQPTSRFSGRDALDGRKIASGTYPAVTTTDHERYATVAFLPENRLTKSAVSFLGKSGLADVAVPPGMLSQFGTLFEEKPETLWVADSTALLQEPKGVADKDALVATAKAALATGAKDVRLFIPSRTSGAGLAADRAALDAVDALGVGTWAHSTFETYTNSADLITSPFEYGLPRDKVGVEPPPIMGDPYGGMEETDSRLVENWHAIGTPLYLVVTLPAGIEDYALWRRAVGLQCFYVGYEGFVLPQLLGETDPWNDWADARTRSRTFLYPTKTGFIPTLAWEGVADGVTDVRYLSQVRRLASCLRFPEPEDFKVDLEGRKATMWMQWLNPRKTDLDTARLDAIAWIEKLDAVRKAIGR